MITSTMEQSPYTTNTTSYHHHHHHQRDDESDFSLREWAVKSRIRRENMSSRRFSESYIRSFREDPTRSFRSNITISSTGSSPAYYPFKDEIDPSTYSFTTALKALQARAGYSNSWDFLSPEGFSLNAKWSEAEKYISNPLSGEVPMECLSAKTLSGRSFTNSTNRITMSAPLVYTMQSRKPQTKPTAVTIPERKLEGLTRDVGIQSTPTELSLSSPSPNSMPVIFEKSIKICTVEGEDTFKSNEAMKDEKEVRIKESVEKEQTEVDKEEAGEKVKGGGGCLSWMRRRQREKHKPRKKKFLALLKGC